MKITEVKKNKGFSLIEILIFITLISIVLITSVGISVLAIKRFKDIQYNTMATYYSTYLENWLEAEKEKNWNNFKAKANNSTYCFNQNIISDWPATQGNCTNSFGNPPIFKREVSFTTNDNNGKVIITAKISTKWPKDNNKYAEVKIIREFYK